MSKTTLKLSWVASCNIDTVIEQNWINTELIQAE